MGFQPATFSLGSIATNSYQSDSDPCRIGEYADATVRRGKALIPKTIGDEGLSAKWPGEGMAA